jgi:asparagine synthase (glutamine-hydrolysing)
MCGIWGWWQRDGAPAPEEDLIRRMTECMRSRGPDDFGSYRSPTGFAMGFRRLAIIDLVTGRQPMANEDGSIQLISNGEIYNFRELRERLVGLGHEFTTRSDAEVVVHGYEQWGDAVLDHLCGMFAIALWDQNRQRLLLARDRLGIKPLYVFEGPNAFGFASDPRALIAMPGAHAGIDHEALALYLYYGYVPAPWSIFDRVRKLRPGEFCVVDRESTSVRRYWDLRFDPAPEPPGGHERRFADLFHEVSRQHLISDVSLGCFLSGGLDSTSVVMAATEVSRDPLLTFNLAFDDPDANEAKYARFAAETLGTNHREIRLENDPTEAISTTLSHFPEPFGDSAAVPNFQLAGLIKKLCTVALSGDGGDEVFAGYSLRRIRVLNGLRRVPEAVRSLGSGLPALGRFLSLSLDDTANLYAESRARIAATDVARLLPDFPDAPRAIAAHIQIMRDELERADVRGSINPFLFLDQSFGLSDQMLTKVDVTSMAHSLEVRVPMIDHRMVEYAATLPEAMKQKGFGPNRTKRIIRSYLRPKFPKKFIRRSKRGFGMPLRGDLRCRLESELFLDGEGARSILPDGVRVDRLLHERPLDGVSSRTLWNLSALSVWNERVFGGPR